MGQCPYKAPPASSNQFPACAADNLGDNFMIHHWKDFGRASFQIATSTKLAPAASGHHTYNTYLFFNVFKTSFVGEFIGKWIFLGIPELSQPCEFCHQITLFMDMEVRSIREDRRPVGGVSMVASSPHCLLAATSGSWLLPQGDHSCELSPTGAN